MGIYNMSWTQSEYSKNQINKAGKRISHGSVSESESAEAHKIIANWRAAHAYPLYVITRKLRNICGDNASVVHRLKRMESIIGKLKRFDNMSLYGMQDIGGCRVIAPSVKDVYSIAEKYENSRIRHIMHKENDYLINPKHDGYRSLHRIYEYRSDDPGCKYNKMKIEIQFRTQLQHAWATAVEIMSLYANSNLKSGIGEPYYFRFFALVSSVFADYEKSEPIPDTPSDMSAVISELKDLNSDYSITDNLLSVSKIIKFYDETDKSQKYDYFLLSLNMELNFMHVYAYRLSDIEIGIKTYNRLENDCKTNNVFVSARSFSQLRSAYPNYFGDVGYFLHMLHNITGI